MSFLGSAFTASDHHFLVTWEYGHRWWSHPSQWWWSLVILALCIHEWQDCPLLGQWSSLHYVYTSDRCVFCCSTMVLNRFIKSHLVLVSYIYVLKFKTKFPARHCWDQYIRVYTDMCVCVYEGMYNLKLGSNRALSVCTICPPVNRKTRGHPLDNRQHDGAAPEAPHGPAARQGGVGGRGHCHSPPSPTQ